MTLFLQLPLVAGVFSLVLAGVSVVRRQPSPATWCFFAGMIALGSDSILTGLALGATGLAPALRWMTASSILTCFIPAIWLCFSLTYSRSGYREFLDRWRLGLVLVGVVPAALSLAFRDQLIHVVSADAANRAWRLQIGPMATVLNAVLLVALVLILMNLEQTFRSAVGTMRWRIKYVVLALVVILGARLYVSSQAILFSAPAITLWSIQSGGLLIGCLFLTLAYARTGWREIDVHPSTAVLRSSLTVILVGGYLFVVGTLALIVSRFGGAELFQLQAFVLLLGMAGLFVLLLSDRARQVIHRFVDRHFKKAQHDSARIWTLFSRKLARVTEQDGLSTVSAKLIAETFDVLSVTVWLLDEETGRVVMRNSTGRAPDPAGGQPGETLSTAVTSGLQGRSSPFDLDGLSDPWATELRRLNPAMFPNGGHRWCVPLQAGTRTVGLVVLADRINGAAYTVEELELLTCIADQITSVLLNIRLADEVSHARELEAFRTMSAFFVHDLKNAAASLNLMLNNLPVHFDDPAFRQDALRGIANTAQRIDDMIARLSALRDRPDSGRVDTDLNQVVTATLAAVNNIKADVEVVSDLQPLPTILANREQIQSVVTNLLLNAREAVVPGGRIRIRTEQRDDRVVLSVVDNGCGMSAAFVRDSLFRPFQSSKRQGLGIGLFQSRAIVLAHGGGVHVESEIGKGSSFQASFPISGRSS